MSEINKFEGEFDYLSNFYPCIIAYEDLIFKSVEHAYQAAKSIILEEKSLFCDSKLSPGQAKRLGKTIKIRSDWEIIKLQIMKDLVKIKFEDSILFSKLQFTTPAELIEGNYWHDQFWGDCICEKHISIPGKNHLGIILMEVRNGQK
jgi:ribA/ribD-fused uncharacterized protein